MRRADRRFNLGGGIAAALVLAAGGAAGLALLVPLFGSGVALRLLVALLGLGYVLYVLGRSRERVGRIATVGLWALCAAGIWLVGLPLPAYVLVHVGMLWLVRSLYCRSGVLGALADLGLCVLGLGFAAWAMSRSGSVPLALWCFFLIQAFHASIPSSFALRGAAPRDEDAAFDRAHRAAEAALKRFGVMR
jgi:hypothetical protein